MVGCTTRTPKALTFKAVSIASNASSNRAKEKGQRDRKIHTERNDIEAVPAIECVARFTCTAAFQGCWASSPC